MPWYARMILISAFRTKYKYYYIGYWSYFINIIIYHPSTSLYKYWGVHLLMCTCTFVCLAVHICRLLTTLRLWIAFSCLVQYAASLAALFSSSSPHIPPRLLYSRFPEEGQWLSLLQPAQTCCVRNCTENMERCTSWLICSPNRFHVLHRQLWFLSLAWLYACVCSDEIMGLI